MLSWLITLLVISSFLQQSLCGNPKKAKEPNKRVCVTETCRSVAAQFIASMNKRIDPCDNFYEFACGKWNSNNPQPKYFKGRWDNSALLTLLLETRLRDELQKKPSTADIIPIRKMKRYYKSCMLRKSDGIELIREILESTSGWPMIMHHDKWKSHAMDWQDIDHYYFFDLLMESPFYTVAIEMRSTSYFHLVIKPPSFNGAQHEYRDTYRSLMMKVASILIKQNKAKVSEKQLEEDIDRVITLEKKIYESVTGSIEDMVGSNPKKIIRKWNEKSKEFKKSPINWKVILQRLLKLTDHSSSEYPVVFENIHYFENLAKIIASTDKRTIVNFMQWKVMSILLPHTTVEMDDLFNSIGNNVNNIEVKSPRWLNCLQKAATNHAAFYIFINKYYTEKSRKAAKTSFHQLVDAYKHRVENTNWLSQEGKNALKKNLILLSDELAHTVFYDNEDNINEYFEELHFGDNYLENFLIFARHQLLRRMTYWGRTNESIDLENPLHSKTELDGRTLRIAPLYLQSPVFDKKLPNYVSYSMVGTIIAHEIGHIFDGFKEILNGSDMEEWKDRLWCFVEVYDTYFKKHEKAIEYRSISGRFTLNENVADWNGLQIAFQAYKKMKSDREMNGELKLPEFEKYTDEQMFFISFAQVWCSGNFHYPNDDHSPNIFRVIGVLSNTADFAAAFKCPKNSPMNPTKKCKIWTE